MTRHGRQRPLGGARFRPARSPPAPGGGWRRPRFTALTVIAVGAVIYAAACPAMGLLSDRVGRRPVSLAGGAGLAVFGVPAFLLMATGDPVFVLLGLVVFALFQAMHISTTTVMLVELFPAGTRSTGSAVGYNLGAALIAGPGPMIAAALATGGAGLPAVYLVVVAAVCTVVLAIVLPETRQRDLHLARVADGGVRGKPANADLTSARGGA